MRSCLDYLGGQSSARNRGTLARTWYAVCHEKCLSSTKEIKIDGGIGTIQSMSYLDELFDESHDQGTVLNSARAEMMVTFY